MAVSGIEVLLTRYRRYLVSDRGLSGPVADAYSHWVTPFVTDVLGGTDPVARVAVVTAADVALHRVRQLRAALEAGREDRLEALVAPGLRDRRDGRLHALAGHGQRRRHAHGAVGERGAGRGPGDGVEGAALLRERGRRGGEQRGEQGGGDRPHGPTRKQLIEQEPPPLLTMLAENALLLVRVIVARWLDCPK